MAADAPTTPYDVVAYAGGTFPQTHPSNLAAVARLHGVPAPSPARCRVLELGTADAGNLLPMALAYPHAEFVGCDLAPTAVDKGVRARDALGLKNLTLVVEDLCALPDSLGRFDYILAHGVFSWVPEFVRDGLLDLCRRLLTPHGVAYVSYNAMPGGHVNQIFSDILRHHVRHISDPAEQLQQARRIMRVVHDGTVVPGPLGEAYKAEARRTFQDCSDSILFHDTLAAENRRYYFHEFAEKADRFGLKFLAEADYFEMTNAAYPDAVAAVLDQLGQSDRIQEEQYRDFLSLRRFRQTLLVRSDVPVTTPARLSEIAGMSVIAHPLTPESPHPDLTHSVQVRFSTPKGSRVTVDHPLAKATLLELAAQPLYPVPVGVALAAAADRLGLPPAAVGEPDARAVFAMLFQVFQAGMVQLAVDPPTFAARPGPTPVLSPLTRYELDAGELIVTTLRHNVVRIETPLTKELLLACDGTRDWNAILDRLTDWAAALPTDPAGPAQTRDDYHKKLAGEIEFGLSKLAELALLTA